MFADMIQGMEQHLKNAVEHHQKLKRKQERMQTNTRILQAEVDAALQTKLLLEMNLELFRQVEWNLNHPAREATTQVRDFQLPMPPSMTLPIVFHEPPASPAPEPFRKNSRKSPPVRKAAPGKLVAVVHGYSRGQRAFIDNGHRF